MKNEVLSMTRFKKPNGEMKTVEEMDKQEKLAFSLATGMKKVIETLEVSIQNDRVFSRAKFNVMQIFHSMLDEIDGLEVN
jgi:hypothetical protein